MADYIARIAPFINQEFFVTSEWWEQPRNHRGLDIATPTSVGNAPLYSMCDGTVVFSGSEKDSQGNLTGYGNYLIMKDDKTGMGFLYAHLERIDKNLNDKVKLGELVGLEGTTGTSTGIHLHLEMQDLSSHDWIYGAPKETYTNPAEFMGIPNTEGISAIYYGIPEPPFPPTPIIKKKSNFKWILYAKKLRNRKIMT